MKQTPVHEMHNDHLLALMPKQSQRIVEVGSSSGALARAFKEINSACHYTGIEIDAQYAALSRRHCDSVIHASVEDLADDIFDGLFPSDCWVFADSLEHLYDPWQLLRRIRGRIAAGSSVVACIPNAQHWTMQTRLNSGLFRYEDSGLLDRTHIRWFTKLTIQEMFETAGFTIVEGGGRIYDEPGREVVLEAIRYMAETIHADPEQAVNDAIPFQWIVRAEAI